MAAVLPEITQCCSPSCPDETQVLVPGPAGTDGEAGDAGADGVSSFTTITTQFTMPAVSSNVVIQVLNSEWMAAGQIIYIQNAGYFQFVSSTSATNATITNLGYTGNVAPTTAVAAGNKVSPSGTRGATGATGAAGTSMGVMTFGAHLDPNGNVVGSVNDIYKSSIAMGGDGTLWLKRTGTATDTGWE